MFGCAANFFAIDLQSTGKAIDENGISTPLPESAIDLFSGNIEIPSAIVQQWGASDDIIWTYVAAQLNLTLI